MKNVIDSLTTEIILGKPSEGCQGHGICRILTQSAIPTLKCPTVTTIISRTADNKLRLFFQKSALSRFAKELHFAGVWFHIEEPVVLPGRLKSRLQLQYAEIVAGSYKITENSHFYIVDF